ncbi:MAG: hypothetical protein CMC50_00200 [Flavobacteriaceae bacterium]|nr:hypothetical protein [Flavobacteriaceae bacterium]
MIKDVVILVGGLGTRLGSITKNTPKPLLKINNICFLDQLICKLIKYNFKNIYLMCSYKKERFFNKYHNVFIHKTRIICIDEGKAMGTGGALFKIRNKIKNNFILLNGDTFFDIDFNILKNKQLNKKNVFMCITYKKNTINNFKLNNIYINKGVVSFSNKKTNFTNGGIYLINNLILKKIKNKYCSFENDILKSEINKNKVIGNIFKDNFIDIGSHKKLNFLNKNPNIIKNKCFFLDRDGVINKERGYITNFKKFTFLNGVKKAIHFLNKKRYLVIIITNQAAIGKGIITEKQLKIIHNKMRKELLLINKACVDDIYYAPYFKNSKKLIYRKNKYDRKPNPGMIIKAEKKWNIDLSSSIFIGDKLTDKQAAIKSNLRFYYKKDVSLYKQVRSIIK